MKISACRLQLWATFYGSSKPNTWCEVTRNIHYAVTLNFKPDLIIEAGSVIIYCYINVSNEIH